MLDTVASRASPHHQLAKRTARGTCARARQSKGEYEFRIEPRMCRRVLGCVAVMGHLASLGLAAQRILSAFCRPRRGKTRSLLRAVCRVTSLLLPTRMTAAPIAENTEEAMESSHRATQREARAYVSRKKAFYIWLSSIEARRTAPSAWGAGFVLAC